jgi:hypothetical protein
VTDWPNVPDDAVETTVLVDAEVTVSVAVFDDDEKFPSPPYVALTVSVPTGALVARQEPEPPLRDAVHNAVVPTAKVTVPVGVPDDPVLVLVTVAW